MGWKTSLLVIEGGLPSLEQALFQAGFGPRREGGAKRLEDVLDPRGDRIYAGVVGDRTVIVAWALQELLSDDDLSDEAAALHQVFGARPFAVVGLHSAVGHAAFACFAEGRCHRRRVEDGGGVHRDEGEPRPWEEADGEASVFALLDQLFDDAGGFLGVLDRSVARWHPVAEHRVKVRAQVEVEPEDADDEVTEPRGQAPADGDSPPKKGFWARLLGR